MANIISLFKDDIPNKWKFLPAKFLLQVHIIPDKLIKTNHCFLNDCQHVLYAHPITVL